MKKIVKLPVGRFAAGFLLHGGDPSLICKKVYPEMIREFDGLLIARPERSVGRPEWEVSPRRMG